MSYTLRAHISTGRIDSDALGSFEIRDSELEAEDYATAAALVEQYNVEWPDGDPNPDEDAEPVDTEDTDDAEAFDAVEFVDRTPMEAVVDDLESGEYDDHLDAIESEASRHGVLDTISARREE